MPVSDAQKKAAVRYLEKLDEVRIRMPKGRKATIQAHAEAQGQSVNAYINMAIDERIAREAAGSSTRAVGARISKDIAEDENDVLGPSDGRREGIAGEGGA